jgi:hypothetical protein
MVPVVSDGLGSVWMESGQEYSHSNLIVRVFGWRRVIVERISKVNIHSIFGTRPVPEIGRI